MYPHETKSVCLNMRFSPETTKKNNMKKIRRFFKQVRN